MTQKTVDRVNGQYQVARKDYVNAIAALASRAQNISYLYNSKVLEILRPLLSDVVPSIQNTAIIALARIAGHDKKMAEEIVKNQSLILLLSGFTGKNKLYKKSALFLIRSIGQHCSELAQAVVDAGGLDAIILCLEDFDPKVREESCWAIEYISRQSSELAEKIVDTGALPLFVVCLQQEEVSLKQAASAALGNISRLSLELAQAAVDAKAIPFLARCLKNPDTKLKRQLFLTLSNIAKHNLELAELVLETEILPEVLVQTAHADDLVKRNASVLVREVVKHSVEMAEYVVNCGGVAALIRVLESTSGPNRLPAIMAIGYIAAQSERLASAIINAKGVSQLAAVLCDEKEEHIVAAAVWTLGHIGKHSSEHSKCLAMANAFPKMMKLYSSAKSSGDLRQKAKESLKQTLKKCTHLHALESLLEDAPLPMMKYILGQFSKVLPHDSRARRLFVITGGLRKVQQLVAEKGTPLHDYISIINLCFPEEIVSYYSPEYPAYLLQRLENFEPKIPPDVLLADRRSSVRSFRSGDVPYPQYKERSQDEETAPLALPYKFSRVEDELYADTASTDGDTAFVDTSEKDCSKPSSTGAEELKIDPIPEKKQEHELDSCEDVPLSEAKRTSRYAENFETFPC